MVRTVAVVAIICTAASAQPQPSFEAATVRPAAPATAGGRAGLSGDRLSYRNTTLLNALSRAFDLKFRGQVIGPDWVFTQRYDITAKAPNNAPTAQISRMLQALLIERFKLTLHHETRELPMYSLVRGKGQLRLKDTAKPDGAKNGWDLANGHRAAKNMSMTSLAQFVTLMLAAPVLDRTGLSGYYDFPLELTLEETGGATATQADSRSTAPSVFTLLQDLGLKLEPSKAPFDVVVIDQGDKVPIDN
jgi:uncharacterized protein (TIGR03435 family)